MRWPGAQSPCPVVHKGLKFEGHGCKPLWMGSSLEIGGRLTRKGVGNKGLGRMLSSIVEMKVREGSGFECTCLGTSDPIRGVGNKVQCGRGAG